MPRYFFDVEDANEFIRDEDGHICESDAQVRKAAIEALPGMIGMRIPDGDTHKTTVKVRDEAGAYIYSASLTLEAGWIGKRSQ
ncbi:DUF6894 family protein [Jiella sonneratiae]|uniref:DUF6894 domain-containing protein n=1 Tax=Jiella sonneratiae TaxID=2816856 RepID=A0ABS3J7H2_9HYPH|nr:hypothetical protein [Jiella sonneratiae]MBO0905615.1 hypothetical protein [Jiella sonneratiae]